MAGIKTTHNTLISAGSIIDLTERVCFFMLSICVWDDVTLLRLTFKSKEHSSYADFYCRVETCFYLPTIIL